MPKHVRIARMFVASGKETMAILQKTTKSCEETERFAEEWGKTLVGGNVVLLHGDLGAGKTHFVKGLARSLGVDDVVTSPTFALHNAYRGNVWTLNHFDFYRVESSEEVELLGLNEFFYDKSGICAIEWSERIADLLPSNCISVTLEKISDTERKITVS